MYKKRREDTRRDEKNETRRDEKHEAKKDKMRIEQRTRDRDYKTKKT